MSRTALENLFTLLADIFQTEGRSGGDGASSALRAARARLPDEPEITPCFLPGLAEHALSVDPHPKAQIIRDALPFIPWFQPVDIVTTMAADTKNQMLAAELLGPTGLVQTDHLRVGLFLQAPDFDYATRTHAAEETYVQLGGVGYWGTDDRPPQKRKTGDIIFHPAMIPHQNVTRSEPVIAAWRWSGDIDFAKYGCGRVAQFQTTGVVSPQ